MESIGQYRKLATKGTKAGKCLTQLDNEFKSINSNYLRKLLDNLDNLDLQKLVQYQNISELPRALGKF